MVKRWTVLHILIFMWVLGAIGALILVGVEVLFWHPINQLPFGARAIVLIFAPNVGLAIGGWIGFRWSARHA